jgi:maltooligosyltrehalose trehalohydrolase
MTGAIPGESAPSRTGFGAVCRTDGVFFRVWAPESRAVEVVLENDRGETGSIALERRDDGTFAGLLGAVHAGQLYRYRVDGRGPYPDPASRRQPRGVHGPSEVVDPRAYAWADSRWPGGRLEGAAVYELHVGTFTPAGTFSGVRERLSHLRELGIGIIELMPVADFAGERNWGYDGVALYAPARCYGTPDDLRSLVDEAHALGLGVVLDVVYNHLGPSGAYHGCFSPRYFSKRHRTPWGPAMNLDGEGSEQVREFFIDNALCWLAEYHFDGLRLDATHALIDDGPRHFLAELSSRVHTAFRDRPSAPLLIAEDHRNLARMVISENEGGWALDAVWADDFHHHMRRALAGDREGYFADFGGSSADIAASLERGWFYCGQPSPTSGKPRGTDPSGLPPNRFVVCLQNHDQVGNRAFGDRLHNAIDLASYRAASALLLAAPETPMLFMGQEWAASTPFLFFTNHERELGKRVTEGRRREFASFSAFRDDKTRAAIPDPQAPETFRASVLDWREVEREPHAATLRLYRELLRLRREEPALAAPTRRGLSARAVGENAVVLVRGASSQRPVLVVAQLRGGGEVVVDDVAGGEWQLLLDTEDPRFSPDPQPARMKAVDGRLRIELARPSAVILVGVGRVGEDG